MLNVAGTTPSSWNRSLLHSATAFIRGDSQLIHAQEMTFQDHLNMQEFLNQLPSPHSKTQTASPRTAEYAMMKELYG